MKNIFSIIILLNSVYCVAQVAIGKAFVSAGSNTSLEFYDSSDNVKGLILPWTSTVLNNPIAYDPSTGSGYRGIQGVIADGTIIFDLSDKKVKYRKNGSWFDLTGVLSFPLVVKDALNNDIIITGLNTIDSSLQDNIKEESGAKTSIGNNSASDNTNGILVLTDDNKAMVLPKVASPHLNIVNPAPGLIAYDTVKRQLAVFNGTVWSFWKP